MKSLNEREQTDKKHKAKIESNRSDKKGITCLLSDPDKLNEPDDASFVVNDNITVLVKQ